jgi:hypothetical protein
MLILSLENSILIKISQYLECKVLQQAYAMSYTGLLPLLSMLYGVLIHIYRVSILVHISLF